MNSFVSLFGYRRGCITLIILAALPGTLLSLQMAYEVGNGAFKSDYFRHFFYIVIPYIEGSGDLTLFFKNHHASPLMHLHQILTTLVLDHSLRFDAYAGITLFFAMAVGLATTAFYEISARSSSQIYGLATALLVCTLLTGPTATRPIIWPLIYLQAYFLCLGLLVAVAAYRLCCEEETRTQHLFIYFCAVTLAILLHTSYGMLFFVATIPVLVIRVFVKRDYRLLLLLAITTALVWAWNNRTLPLMGQMELRGTGYTVEMLTERITQLPYIIAAFGKALLNGLFGDTITFTVRKDEPTGWQLVSFGAIAFVYFATTLFALLQSRKVLIAGMIMLAVLLGAASALLSRGGDSFPFNIDAPRYVLLYRLAIAAFFWAIADAVLSISRVFMPQLAYAARNRVLIAAAVVVLFIVVIIQVIAFRNIQERKNQISVVTGWSELAIFMRGVDGENTFTLQDWQAGGNPRWVSGRVISWLVDRRANVFSPDYRASPYLANYIRGHAAYEEPEQPLLLDVDSDNCVKHSALQQEKAWKASLESSVEGDFLVPAGTGNLSYFIRPGFQNIYGILPPEIPLHVCFPTDVVVKSFGLVSVTRH